MVLNNQIYLKNCILKFKQILDYKQNIIQDKMPPIHNESSQSLMNFIGQSKDAPFNLLAFQQLSASMNNYIISSHKKNPLVSVDQPPKSRSRS